MKRISQNIITQILLLLILFIFSNCANKEEFNNSFRILNIPNDIPPNNPPDDVPPSKDNIILEQQKEKLESDYKIQLEENNKLKKQIEKNIKYIKILLTTGIIMFSIIVYISFKIIVKYTKKKSNSIEINNSKLKQSKIDNNNLNISNERSNISSSTNSSIQESNFNLFNSAKSINMSNNIIIPEVNINNNSIKYKSFEPEEEKNYDAPKMANYSNIVINDDNKTLTNNPDMFVPSRMDRILYQPYSKEEIK